MIKVKNRDLLNGKSVFSFLLSIVWDLREYSEQKRKKKKEEKKSCFGTMSEETLSHCGEESFVLCKINDETNEEVYRSRN